jgi:hypothetical protein
MGLIYTIDIKRQLSFLFFIILITIGTIHISYGAYIIAFSGNKILSDVIQTDTILGIVSKPIGINLTFLIFGIIEIISGYMLYSFRKSKSKALLGISINTLLFVTTLSLTHISNHTFLITNTILNNAILIKDFTLLGLGIILFGYMVTNTES